MSVTSTLGKGTTFTVTLPTGSAHLPVEQIRFAQSPQGVTSHIVPSVQQALHWLTEGTRSDERIQYEPQSPLQDEKQEIQQEGSGTGHVAHILLVEDDSDLRDYLASLLSNHGYAVEAVGSGRAALDALEQHVPDPVLSDVMMPDGDGLSLLREIRATASLQRLPVLLLSARAGEEATLEGLSTGADDYLIKPISARELLARVRTARELGYLREQAVERARHSVELLQGLYEVTLAVNSTLSPQSILALISEQARLLLNARYALTSFTEEGEWAQALVSVSSALSRPDADLPDIEHLVREQLEGLRHWYESLQGQSPSAHWLEAPLLERDGSEVGFVQLTDREEETFTEEDRLVFLQFAQMTSLALSNARRYAQAQDALASNQLTMEVMEWAAQSLQAPLDALSHYLEMVQKALHSVEHTAKGHSLDPLLKERRQTLQALTEHIRGAAATASP